MTPQATKFQKQLAFGVIAESAIANWLRARGNAVLPVYDIEYESGKGPRLFTAEKNLIAPDLLIFKGNTVRWIEAKHKTVFSWHRNSKRWVTGIDIHHYENYLQIADAYPWEVWLMFLHRSSTPSAADMRYECPPQCPVGLFAGKISDLRHKENHRHKNHGRSGMVYWSSETLIRLAGLEMMEAKCA